MNLYIKSLPVKYLMVKYLTVNTCRFKPRQELRDNRTVVSESSCLEHTF